MGLTYDVNAAYICLLRGGDILRSVASLVFRASGSQVFPTRFHSGPGEMELDV